jgi:hypothetical protein
MIDRYDMRPGNDRRSEGLLPANAERPASSDAERPVGPAALWPNSGHERGLLAALPGNAYRTLLASILRSTPADAPGVGWPNSAEFCFHFSSVSCNPEIYSNSILFKFECHVKSKNMFKLEFVQIQICSNLNLFKFKIFKLEIVQIQICSNSNLFKLKLF